MKVALIIEKPEVGGVLPSLAAEGAAPDVALSQATFLTAPAPSPQPAVSTVSTLRAVKSSLLSTLLSVGIFLSVLRALD